MISNWLSNFMTFDNSFIKDIMCAFIVFALVIILFSVVCGALFGIGKKH